MTKEKLAAAITGAEYPFELTNEQRKIAMDSNLLVVYGGSDDLCIFDGVIQDEVDAPGDIFILGRSILKEIEDDEEEVLRRHHVFNAAMELRKGALKIEARLGAIQGWSYKTDAPHATFDIMEDGAIYCRGLVIDMKEVKP